ARKENKGAIMLENELEANLKGLVDALGNMHNRFIGAGVENYYLKAHDLQEVFKLDGYFTSNLGFYYIPRVFILDKHSDRSIDFPIVIEKKNAEIFNCENKAKKHAYWCVDNHRLFGYGLLLKKAHNNFSERAYNELADVICEALNKGFKEKKEFDFISFQEILDMSYKFENIEIKIDATYNKMGIFSFKADLERFTNEKYNYHFVNLMEKVARELNITIETKTDYGTLFEVGIEYIDKINTAFNLASYKLMDYLSYKEKRLC
ncbi:hypothetical protein ACOWLS_06535, partial [Helicobacter pylori]